MDPNQNPNQIKSDQNPIRPPNQELLIWAPLRFWFNRDVGLALPFVAIPIPVDSDDLDIEPESLD